MVTHEAPLDTYLNRLIAAVENLTEVLDSIHGLQIKIHDDNQLHQNDIWQEAHNIENQLDRIAGVLEQELSNE